MRHSITLRAAILIALVGCNATCIAHPCGALEGVVQRIAGAPPIGGRTATSPISDATVTLRLEEGGAPIEETHTGEDGRFRFSCLAPGRYAVSAAADHKIVTVTPNGVAHVSLYRRMP